MCQGGFRCIVNHQTTEFGILTGKMNGKQRIAQALLMKKENRPCMIHCKKILVMGFTLKILQMKNSMMSNYGGNLIMGISNLDKKIATLSPKINQNGIDVVQTIQDAYFFYKQTGSGAGLVQLAALLEDENTGWLVVMHGNAMHGQSDRFYNLIDKLPKPFDSYKTSLHQFRKIRNRCHGNEKTFSDEIEQAFIDFTEFAEIYYKSKQSIPDIYDESYYQRCLRINEKIANRFKIVKCLGGNVDSQVYKVLDMESNKDRAFALKRVLVTSTRYNEMVTNEKKARSLFNGHPNIGRYYSSQLVVPVGEVLVLEYIEGKTLREWVTNRVFDAKGISDYLYIIGRILDGLKYIHGKDYVYAAIRPENIVVTNEGSVKMVEFDRCVPNRSYFSEFENREHSLDVFVPDSAKNKTKDIDTYALGVMMEQHLEKAVLPDSMRIFIKKACSKKPTVRYADAWAMYRDWEKIYHDARYEIQGPDHKARKIALISCTRRKKQALCSARELYSASDRFARTLAYAENTANGYDQIYIISARYGLVELNQQLAPYNCDLLEFPPEDQRCWAGYIVQLLRWKGIDSACKVVVHADDLYGKLIMDALNDKGIPVEYGTFE